jgi:integrase/recombinase XerC
MVNKFLQYLQYEKNYSSHTILSYKTDISQFISFVNEPDIDFSSISSDTIRQWILHLMENDSSARTINRKLSALKSFYRYMNQTGELKKNPVKNIISPKTKKPLPLFFKEKEVTVAVSNILIKNTFENVRDALIIEMFYETGMRESELIHIKDTDIDFYSNTLKVLGKRRKERIIPFGNNLKEVITNYQDIRNKSIAPFTPYLYVRKDGSQLYPKLVYNVVHKYLSQTSSLSKRSPHVLRHTFASTLLNKGADINAVKELLGHSNLAATEVYTHTSFEQLKDIYKQAHPRA